MSFLKRDRKTPPKPLSSCAFPILTFAELQSGLTPKCAIEADDGRIRRVSRDGTSIRELARTFHCSCRTFRLDARPALDH